MTEAQRPILARMAWIMLQGDRAMLTASEIGATPGTLAPMVRAGYLRSWRPRPDLDRRYELQSKGFYALVGVR